MNQFVRNCAKMLRNSTKLPTLARSFKTISAKVCKQPKRYHYFSKLSHVAW